MTGTSKPDARVSGELLPEIEGGCVAEQEHPAAVGKLRLQEPVALLKPHRQTLRCAILTFR
jgi:hypothetical protein